MRLEINELTWQIAEDAIRDILYMYWDMSQSGAFSHDIELGRFNQYLCLGASLAGDGYGSADDVALLQRGSAVKILCLLSDHIYEHDQAPGEGEFLNTRIRALLREGKLDHLPSAKQALELGLAGNMDPFHKQLDTVYREYVVATFSKAYG